MSETKQSNSWITPDFYHSNAKAEDIRAACLPILQKIYKLLYDPTVSTDEIERNKLYAQIELDEGTLIELSVEPRMATGKSLKEYQANPLLTAQYLAGQVLDMTGSRMPSQKESTGSIGENTTVLRDDIKMAESADVAPKTRDFMVNQQMFTFIRDNFAFSISEISGFPSETE